MDGKHILIRPPANSGSYYFNYKSNFSIVLMALVDAHYKFIYVDVGCNGRISDGGVFKNCSLQRAFDDNSLHIPQPEPLPGQRIPTPFVIVADDAFPLKSYIMKPYPRNHLSREKRIFNYRLSRARRISENAFGILSNCFRVFMTPICLEPAKVESIVMASCTLHNYLREHTEAHSVYMPQGTLDTEDPITHSTQPGEWRKQQQSQSWVPLQRQGSNHHSNAAKRIRNHPCSFFVLQEGEVPWQYNMI